jgi:acetylornithine deacetylase/succinyl-diaminopimelate desuccinylase-like protein
VPEREDLERRATGLLQRLIRFNTVNPPGDEQAAQEHLKGLLEAAGFDCELVAAVPGRPNLVARLGSGTDGPRLALLGHVDTVLATPADWAVDPWSGELRDGYVWGRGAVDMKSQVAAEVTAATALAEEGWRPEAGELLVIVTCDEETGSAHGARWLCHEHPDKVRCDMVVNEGGGGVIEFGGRRAYTVAVAEKGVARFTVSTTGHAAHASVPRAGDNALLKMAPLIEALAEPDPDHELSAEPEALLRGLGLDPSDIPGAMRALRESDLRLALLVDAMLGVTLAPTMISASEKINVIPSRAELHVDCRVPPELDESRALARIRGVLGDDGYELDWDRVVVGNRSPMESPLMDAIEGWVERTEPGAGLVPLAMVGFSDSRWFREVFPNCVAYGFYPQAEQGFFDAGTLMHAADERMSVSDLGLAASFYADLMLETLR